MRTTAALAATEALRSLDSMARKIEADLKSNSGDAVTIFLGDYIDRGPDSRAVLEMLSSGSFPTRVIALRGNHELRMQSFLDEPAAFDPWRRMGGLETMVSYGVDVTEAMRGRCIPEARLALIEAIPPRHIDFLRSLRLYHETAEYFFSHAGIRPGIPLDRQLPDDLLWIRFDFLDSMLDHGKVIIHGHTPVEKPDFKANRINLDTGAYATGRLTCLVLEGNRQRLLQVG